ncbi:YdjY domain-containing protein [Rubripirellula sp.]|nr:YdjY domain-containing protein [Rubripirellula sp.]
MARILPFYIPLAILVFTLPAAVCCSQETDETPKSLNDPLTEEEKAITTDTYVPPDQIVRKAFEAPPNSKQLSSRLVWIDREKQRVYADGFVTMRDGPLEMFACPVGTKEHEAIVATISKSSELHTALLAIGAQPGTPVSYVPNFVPATGQRIRVWICYYDKDSQFKAVDARRWVQKNGTNKQMDSDWVFAGSGFWKDPSNGREYYRADSGDMICVSNFSTAMLDIPVASSADASNLLYIPFTERIPERGTPVRLVFVPIPIPNDQPEPASKVDASKPPTKAILPKKK